MKTPFVFLSMNKLFQYILSIAILFLFSFSCEKENSSKISFEFNAIDIIYYPEKHISMTFKIIPEGDNGPFTLKWYEPDSLNGEGPYAIEINDDLKLDFEIQNAINTLKRFTYEIKVDTIDSLKYDYRNGYIGSYVCNVTYSSNGYNQYFIDTLTVEKNNSFSMLNILNTKYIKYNHEGNEMTYSNSNGNYGYPTGNFYSYHSGALFTKDSIYYFVSGLLGSRQSIDYHGIKINKQ
jgi:hypothetical protein